jgi:hypothetical protein
MRNRSFRSSNVAIRLLKTDNVHTLGPWIAQRNDGENMSAWPVDSPTNCARAANPTEAGPIQLDVVRHIATALGVELSH